MARITKCRNCTMIYDVDELPSMISCNLSYPYFFWKYDLEVTTELACYFCEDCLWKFAKWIGGRKFDSHWNEWFENNPELAIQRKTVERQKDDLNRIIDDRPDLNDEYDRLHNLLYDSNSILLPPRIKFDQPTEQEFNEWLAIVYNKLVKRLQKDCIMERCEVVAQTTGHRCHAWAKYEIDGRFLCGHHHEKHKVTARLSFDNKAKPNMPIMRFFTICAADANEFKKELVKNVPIEWLQELGIVSP